MKTDFIDLQHPHPETTSSMCHSGKWNKARKTYNLQKEDIAVRTDRFISLSKPRSIHRIGGASVMEFDLEEGGVYDIDTLNPLEPKHHQDLDLSPYVFEDDFDVLSWVTTTVAQSPLGYSLLQEAQKSGWRIALGDLETGGFHLDVQDKVIELDAFHMEAASLGQSSFSRNSLVLILTKALRDIWHENRSGGFEETYKPESVLLLERARTADTDSISILIAWELRSAGHNEIWRHVLGGEGSDMARVLVNILERYPTAIYNGMALAHVFRQWYADSARVDALDHTSLQQMDDILVENDVRFGDKTASAKDFEDLSLLPDGISYLKELGETVAKDPFFNGLSDPVNQSHLFQIVYDSKVTYAHGIPFRDARLARKFLN